MSFPTRFRVLAADIRRVEYLSKKTPPRQRIRLVGQLDMIRHSDRMFSLRLDSGETLQGITNDEVDPADLARHFGHRVLLSGSAVFRPSGKVLRIEADQIEAAAGGQTSIWSQIPEPVFGRLNVRGLHQPQDYRTGLRAVLGKWPGGESEEDVAAALEELS